MSLERLPDSTGTTEIHNVLYFAGIPVVLWKKVGTAASTRQYLVDDHLGTPVYAFSTAGAALWNGGLEPFGKDWQEGTANDMLARGVFLRFPGQWDDALFTGATLGADTFYNVYRWYEQGVGRYMRADPANLDIIMNGVVIGNLHGLHPQLVSSDQRGVLVPRPPSIYAYAESLPIALVDHLGLVPCVPPRSEMPCMANCIAGVRYQVCLWRQTDRSGFSVAQRLLGALSGAGVGLAFSLPPISAPAGACIGGFAAAGFLATYAMEQLIGGDFPRALAGQQFRDCALRCGTQPCAQERNCQISNQFELTVSEALRD
jgi:hypothetical protein